ncbi:MULTISPECIES: GTPase Era [Chitinophagaceae]|uniref:GTPase Era n=1 Tax=Pseudobacter ginsenosidimutans TaxID=661488 RepID=A0A4Q7MFL3_9BACT|nr:MULTISPECIES: GTPase Era [Chitinophagaceae]QEC42660.1 GTPase Era [Pseudobacter ginsenosidimutans]RZS65189.1 GTP-binding protein Era [Pseudobacter ginsenosidimutans]
MKTGFVTIFGRPNAGKSTLMNALMGEKLAIVSPKVQTTRHRIRGIITTDDYQIILSDTPGIIDPKYKLQEKMMMAVKSAMEDSDVALLLVDANENLEEASQIFEALKLKVPSIVVINKTDQTSKEKLEEVYAFFGSKSYCKELIGISALKGAQLNELTQAILKYLPEGDPFFDGEEMTDLPTRFFVAEMIREKIFYLYKEEIPYHTTVLITEFKDKTTLTKIVADIVVQRETQKVILLGEGGKMIKQLGTQARKDIEAFLGRKVFLELFVKVRPKWRDNEFMLKEYGYY